jgi:hypothetical protein
MIRTVFLVLVLLQTSPESVVGVLNPARQGRHAVIKSALISSGSSSSSEHGPVSCSGHSLTQVRRRFRSRA